MSILSSNNILELSSQNKFLPLPLILHLFYYGVISVKCQIVITSFSTAVSTTKVVLCDFCSTVFSSFLAISINAAYFRQENKGGFVGIFKRTPKTVEQQVGF